MGTLTAQTIDDAFTALFFQLTGFGALQGDGEVFLPCDDVPYAYGRMAAISPNPGGYGADAVINWQGVYTILVNSPRNLGKQAAGQLADTVVAAFPRGLGVVTATGQAMSVSQASAQPSEDSGDWITIPVQVQWFGSDP